VPVTITIAGRCTATASGTAILGGVMLPSVNPTATATQPIPAGTTTVSLAIVFVPPATETSVAMLLSIIYSGGLSAPTHDSVDYPSDDATTCCALSRV
jgi:hypothetical protein